MTAPMTSGVNRRVAELLRRYAALLEQQEASPFRVNAYRRAAETVDSLDVDLGDLVKREGPAPAVPGGFLVIGAHETLPPEGRGYERVRALPVVRRTEADDARDLSGVS